MFNASRLLVAYSVEVKLVSPSRDMNKCKFINAWRRPTLAEAKPQLPSALESLTAVFGMETGVTSPLLLPDIL